MTFTIGQRVNRIENRDAVSATIIAIEEQPDGPQVLELAYDEGGCGWWPADRVEPITAQSEPTG